MQGSFQVVAARFQRAGGSEHRRRGLLPRGQRTGTLKTCRHTTSLATGEPPMAIVKLIDENCDHPVVRRVFADIKATKKIERIPNIWRALAAHPEHLELCWTRLKAIMRPGRKIDLLTKETIALAVSATNGCTYCVNSHTAAVQKLGLDNEGLAEVLAVVGLYNQMNT